MNCSERIETNTERPDAERLRQQALVISETLRQAGIGPCTLTEGVQQVVQERDALRTQHQALLDRLEGLEAERKDLRQGISNALGALGSGQCKVPQCEGCEVDRQMARADLVTALGFDPYASPDQLATARKEQG